MVLADVNVLVYAHRQDSPRHREYLGWLNRVLSSDAAFGISDLVLSGFLRVVTHPRVFRDPTPLDHALTGQRRCQCESAAHRVADVGSGAGEFDERWPGHVDLEAIIAAESVTR